MKLKLFCIIDKGSLCVSKTSDFPYQLPLIYREDHLDLEIMLLESTGNLTTPLSVVDISNLSIQVAIGEPDSSPEALQTTFTKDTVNNKFTGSLNINTTEMVAAFNAASGNTISRFLEIEVEGTASQYHTVLQAAVTLAKDIIQHPLVAPSNVTTGTAFANSFSATTQDSTTTEWTASGDYNLCHLKGMSGLSSLTAGQYLKVDSAGTGFELGAVSVSQALNDNTDVDLSTASPSPNDLLRFDGTNWVPVAHSINSNTDVDTSTNAPSTNDILSWDGTNWIPSAASSAGTQNLFATFQGDSGTTTADSLTDTLKIQGGAGIDTTVNGDELTVSGEDASTSNKGIASFSPSDFTVNSGNVSLQSISIANGGTGAANAADGFDNLAPTTTAGDLITHDGTDNIRLGVGTAGQVLKVNSAANGVEWGSASAAGSIDGLTDVDTSSSGHVPADEEVLTWDSGMSHWMPKALPVEIGFALSDETTTLYAQTDALTFRMPHAMTLTEVRANLKTAPAGSSFILDINQNGSSILSTKLSIDDGEKTSTTAATPAVISTSALTDDAEITIDCDQAGSSFGGVGLKVWLIGTR